MKAFIVRIPVKSSYIYAEKSAKSCETHGIDWEYSEGVYKKSYNELKNIYDLYYIPNQSWETKLGRLNNCMASNYRLYYKCLELGEPIIILDHDSVVVSDKINSIDVDPNKCITYALSAKVMFENDYKFPDNFSGFNLTSNYFYDSINARIITPKYCENMLEFAKNKNTAFKNNYNIETANSMIDFIETYNYEQVIVDPFPVINLVGDTVSVIESTQRTSYSALSNTWLPNTFYDCLSKLHLKENYRESIKNIYRNKDNYLMYKTLKDKFPNKVLP